MQQHLLAYRQQLTALDRRLQLRHPGQYLRQQAQRMDELEQRLRQGLTIEPAPVRPEVNEADFRFGFPATGF